MVRTNGGRRQGRRRWSHLASIVAIASLLGGAVAGFVATAAPLDTLEQAAAEPPEPPTDPPVIDPYGVGRAASGTATVRVFVGSDRLANGTGESPLAGVELGLANSQGASLRPEPWARCTSDAAGSCLFTVPIGTGGVSEWTYFWVRQTAAAPPAGYYANAQLNVGSTGQTALPYEFPTPRLRSGADYVGGAAYTGMTSGGSQPAATFMSLGKEADQESRSSGGSWQLSRINPAPLAACGVKIAVVIDLSSSVNNFITQLKAAAVNTVQSLVGTPSSMALFTFGTNAPRSAGENLGLTPVSTAAGAQIVINKINGYQAQTGIGTNWDRGLAQVGPGFDIVLVLTDGNPTFSEPGGVGPGSYTRFKELENGIFSANKVKSQVNSQGTVGQRIIAVGVGAALTNNPANLRAISGPVSYPDPGFDYVATADYTAAGQIMRALARAACPGSVSIIKKVMSATGTVDTAVPAGGWTFTASATGGTPSAPSAVTDQATGGVNFAIGFATGVDTAGFTAVETPQPGYSLVPVGGQNATCTTLDGVPVTSTNTANGFSVPVSRLDQITCTVYNRAPDTSASMIVDKLWAINGASPVSDGNQPVGLSAALTIDGRAQTWGVPRDGLTSADTPTIAETRSPTLAECVFTGATLARRGDAAQAFDGSEAVALQPGVNAFEVVNSYDCTSRLTLLKRIRNGPGVASDWTLSAAAAPEDPSSPNPPGTLPGFSGASGVDGEVTPGVTYLLTEDVGDPRYIPNGDVTTLGRVLSWDCAFVALDGTRSATSDGADGDVVIGVGSHLECAIDNLTASLTLSKAFDLQYEGDDDPAQFTLRAVPVGPQPLPPDVEEVVVAGSETGVLSWLRPEIVYELREDGPPGFETAAIECNAGPNGEFVAMDAFIPARLATIQCRFVNRDLPASIIITKESVGFNTTDTRPYAFQGDWEGAESFTIDAPGDGTLTDMVFPVVAPGSYTVTELESPGSQLTALSCDIQGEDVTFDPGGREASFELVAGDTVQCFFTNSAEATLTVIKLTEPINYPQTFSYTFSDGTTTTPFTLAGAPLEQTAQTFDELTQGVYTIDEADTPGWDVVDIDCGPGEGSVWDADLAAGTVQVQLPPDGALTCFYTNRARSAAGAIVKEAAGPADSFGFVLSPLPTGTPVVVPVETSGGTGTAPLPVAVGQRYSLSELPRPGWTPGPIACQLTDAAGTTAAVNPSDFVVGPDGVLACTAANTVVAGSGTITKNSLGADGAFGFVLDTVPSSSPQTVTVSTSNQTGQAPLPSLIPGQTYSLTEPVGVGWVNGSLTCTVTPPGGVAAPVDPASFTTGPGGVVTCVANNTARPVVAKSTASVVPQSASAWTVTYTVTVTNASVLDLTYDLSDTPVLPAGAAITSATATNDAGQDTSAWNGTTSTTLATGVTIAGADPGTPLVHTYTVTLGVALGDDVALGDLACATEGGGLLNGAIMSHGGTGYPAAACADVPVARLTLGKVVDNGDSGRTAQPADWTLTAEPQGIAGQAPVTGDGEDGVQGVLVLAGTYALREDGPAGYTASDWTCEGGEYAAGVVTVAAGGAASCTITNTAHGLEVSKTHDALPGGGAEAGDEITYRATVTNPGPTTVPGASFDDVLPAHTTLVGGSIVAPDGWDTTASTETAVHGVYSGDLPPGVYVFEYRVLVGALPQPDPAQPIPALVNSACVTSNGGAEADACADDPADVSSVTLVAMPTCQNDAAYLAYSLGLHGLSLEPAPAVALIWWSRTAFAARDASIDASDPAALLADGASAVQAVAVPAGYRLGDPIDGLVLWPGMTLAADGAPTAWPGWRLTTDGWVRDASAPFFEVSESAVVEVRVNPSVSAVEVYPPVTPQCDARPPRSGALPPTGFTATGLGPLGAAALGALLVGAALVVRARRRREG